MCRRADRAPSTAPAPPRQHRAPDARLVRLVRPDRWQPVAPEHAPSVQDTAHPCVDLRCKSGHHDEGEVQPPTEHETGCAQHHHRSNEAAVLGRPLRLVIRHPVQNVIALIEHPIRPRRLLRRCAHRSGRVVAQGGEHCNLHGRGQVQPSGLHDADIVGVAGVALTANALILPMPLDHAP